MRPEIVSASKIPVIVLGACYLSPAMRLMQEWLYRTRDADLRFSSVRSLVGWLVGWLTRSVASEVANTGE